MKQNIRSILVFFCLVCFLLSGCKSADTNNVCKENSFTHSDYDKILKKEGSLDNVIDFKKEFCAGYLGNNEILVNEYDTNILKIVNIDSGSQKKITSLINDDKRYMCSWRFRGGWFVWSEDLEADLFVGESIGKNWALKAFNIYTKETITIDKEPADFPKERSFFATPISFSVDAGGAVYKCYRQHNGNLYETINYINFASKDNITVDEVLYKENDKNQVKLDTPYVCNNSIFYGKYKMGDKYTEGTSYIYDIKSKKSKQIDRDMIFEPLANKEKIVAIEKTKTVDTNSSVVIMDYNGKICNKITDAMYTNEKDKPTQFEELKLCNNYVAWHNVKGTQLNVFNISDNIMYDIFNYNSGRAAVNIELFDNNFLLWSEWAENNRAVHNYVILK